MILLRKIYIWYKRKQKLRKCNYGQLSEWIVYNSENSRIAKFVNPNKLDMFWIEYDLLILDKSKHQQLLTDEFWNTNSLKFYHNFMKEYLLTEPIIYMQNNTKPTIRARGLYFRI